MKVQICMNNKTKRIALFALSLPLLVTSCGNKEANSGQAPEFAVQTLQTTRIGLESSYPATIQGKQDVEIRPQVTGFITQLCVDEGATVHKGQALFKIDQTQYKAAFDQAEAGVASAEANLETMTSTEAQKKMLHA